MAGRSRQRPRKQERLTVTLEGGRGHRVTDKWWKDVPDACGGDRNSSVAGRRSSRWQNHASADVDAERRRLLESNTKTLSTRTTLSRAHTSAKAADVIRCYIKSVII